MKAVTTYTEIRHTPQAVLYTVSYPNNTLRLFFLKKNFLLSHEPEANTKRTCVTTAIGLFRLR